MSEGTWTIVASPRERWVLTHVLLSPDVKVKSEQEMRSFHRLRRALGLGASTRAAIDAKGAPVDPEAGTDRTTRNRFDITTENADTLKWALDQITRNAAQAYETAELIEQIYDRRTSAPDAETAPPLDVAAETERWEIPPPPYLQEEHSFVAFIREVAKKADSFAAFKDILLEGLKTPAEREADAKRAGLRSV